MTRSRTMMHNYKYTDVMMCFKKKKSLRNWNVCLKTFIVGPMKIRGKKRDRESEDGDVQNNYCRDGIQSVIRPTNKIERNEKSGRGRSDTPMRAIRMMGS